MRTPMTRNQLFIFLQRHFFPPLTKALDMYWNGQLIQVLLWATVTFLKLGKVVISSNEVFRVSLKHTWIHHEFSILADDMTKEEMITVVSVMNWLTGAVQDALCTAHSSMSVEFVCNYRQINLSYTFIY